MQNHTCMFMPSRLPSTPIGTPALQRAYSCCAAAPGCDSSLFTAGDQSTETVGGSSWQLATSSWGRACKDSREAASCANDKVFTRVNTYYRVTGSDTMAAASCRKQEYLLTRATKVRLKYGNTGSQDALQYVHGDLHDLLMHTEHCLCNHQIDVKVLREPQAVSVCSRLWLCMHTACCPSFQTSP